MVTKNKLQKK